MKDLRSNKIYMIIMVVTGIILCLAGALLFLCMMSDGFNADEIFFAFFSVFIGLYTIIGSYYNYYRLNKRTAVDAYTSNKTSSSADEDIDDETQKLLDAYEKSADEHIYEDEYKEAINDWYKYIETAKSKGYKSKETYGYSSLASLYEDIKEYDKAIENYTKVVNLGEADLYTYSSRARVYTKCEKYKEALDDQLECLKMEDSGYVHMMIGDSYMKMNAFKKALDEYKIAIEYEVKFGKDYVTNGDILYVIYKLANNVKAEPKILVQLTSKAGVAHYFLRDYDAAIRVFKLALKHDPQDEIAKTYLEKALKEKDMVSLEDKENKEDS